MADKMKVLLHGPVLTVSGYGEHARSILNALMTREDIFEIYVHPTPWGACRWESSFGAEREKIDSFIVKTISYEMKRVQEHAPPEYDVSLQVVLPTEWQPYAKVNIGVTSGIEAQKVVPDWDEATKRVDAIIVESQHAKNGFTTDTPFRVISFPVDVPEKKEIDLDLQTDFNFLLVAMDAPRKNVGDAIEGFYKEFHNDADVGLVCKISTPTEGSLDVERIRTKMLNVKRKYPEAKCSLYFLHGDLKREEMFYLYSHPKIKAMVTMTHGEGFGIPLFDAACVGLPIIAPNWSAHTEYLKIKKDEKEELKFSKIDYFIDKVKPEHADKWYDPNIQTWAYPILISYCKKMRSVKDFYGKFKDMASELKDYLHVDRAKNKINSEIVETILLTVKGKENEVKQTSDV